MAQELDTKNSPKSQALFFPKESKYDRTVPNACIRSALFAVVRKGQRKIFKERKIFSQPGYDIYFSGEQLDQLDLDVFCNCSSLGIQPTTP